MVHNKILSRLCTILQRSPYACRAPISTPTTLQKFFQGSALHYVQRTPNATKAFLSTPNALKSASQSSALH